jgi:Fic family protein
MDRFIHQRPGWPEFNWSNAELAKPLATLRFHQGRLLGRAASLSLERQIDATLGNITEDVVRSSQIEGEELDEREVRSSISRRLGLDIGGLIPSSRHVDGIVEVMLDATRNFDQPLTVERLFDWHSRLFPPGRDPRDAIRSGVWRTDARGPMQVVSGALGRERVHFEAPAASRIDGEMARFLDWFNGDAAVDPVLNAGIVYLWFVTIHPFEDGNGRIARAIGDMALARADGTSQRFYSLTAQIHRARAAYYGMLESTQRGSLDITPWLQWFLDMLGAAVAEGESALDALDSRATVLALLKGVSLNDRQLQMIERLLDGFEGKLTAAKWATMTKSSPDTALRDLNDLIAKGVVQRDPVGGRSTSYSLRVDGV